MVKGLAPPHLPLLPSPSLTGAAMSKYEHGGGVKVQDAL